MALLGEIRCENSVLFGSAAWVIPGASLSNTRCPIAANVPNPAVNIDKAMKWWPNPVGANHYWYEKQGILMQDVVNRATSLTWAFAHPSLPNPAINTYSMRFYMHTNGPTADAEHHFISFLEGTTRRWAFYGGDYAWSGVGSPFDFSFQWGGHQPYVNWPVGGGTNGTTRSFNPADGLATGVTWRIEIQVQPSSPKITLKVYNWNSTTPFKTIQTTPTQDAEITTSANRFEIGSPNNVYCAETWYGDFEWYDSYDFDGKVNQHYTPPPFTWTEWNGTTETAVDDEGVWNGTAIDTTDKNNVHDYKREIHYPDTNYTKTTGVDVRTDGLHGFNCVDIYIPNTTAPANGWPTILWVHGGFFVQGDKNELPIEWAKHCLYRGYAVVSVNYHLAVALLGLGPTAGTWPASNSGKWPSFLMDVKAAGDWVKRVGAQGTGVYPLDSTKMAVTGYSAGGGIALWTAASTHLSSFNGYNLTLSNTPYGESTSGVDPEFLCAYGFAAPTNMLKAWDWDPTHPNLGGGWLLGNTTMGTLRVTGNAMLGRTYNTDSRTDLGNLSVGNVVAANAANCPPLGGCWGGSDYLVHWEHRTDLESACSANGVPFSATTNYAFHDLVNEQFKETHFFQFLQSHGMTPGP